MSGSWPIYDLSRHCTRALFVLWTLGATLCWGQAWSPTPPAWIREATLQDVYFIDADSGWACGDRGTILRTVNGGRTWLPCATPRSCRLESIFFVNHNQGWACGGYVSPTSNRSVGVVLRTQDGGQTWTETAARDISWLRRIEFSNPSVGWAVGSVSAHQPSGVFYTRDGGDTWSTASDYAKTSWHDAARFTDQEMVLAGNTGGIERLRTEQFENGYLLDGRLPQIASLAAVDEQRGWAVGERGTIYQTANQGLSWRQAADPARIPGLDQLEFKSITANGQHAWMAGSPGSVVVHTHDDGATWQWTRTGIDVDIERLFFVDDRRGWAVGTLGKIYSTSDGGFSWQPQRNAALRMFALQASARPEDIPLEALARISGNEGWLTSAIMPVSKADRLDPKSDAQPHLEQWIKLTGTSQVTWWNPRHKGLIPAAKLDDNSPAVDQTEQWDDWKRFLALQIRIQRPAVLLVPAPSHSRPSAGQRRFYDICLEACREAASQDAYPDQLTQFGLQPWQTPKVFACSTRAMSKGILIPTDQFALRLGRTLEDLCYPARQAMATSGSAVPKQYQLRLVATELPPTTAGNSLASDLSADWASTAQRPTSPELTGTFQSVQQLTSINQVLDQLGSLNAESDPTGAMWIATARKQILNLDDWSGGNFLHRLAVLHESKEQVRMASRAHRMMLERFPDHPLADASLLWLWGYYSSHEWRWQDDERSNVESIASHRSTQARGVVSFQEMMQQAKQGEDQAAADEVVPAATFEDLELRPIQAGDRRVVPPVFLFQPDAMQSVVGEPAQLQFADLVRDQKDDYLGQLEQYLIRQRPALLSDWRIRLQRLAARQRRTQTGSADWLAIRDYYPGSLAQIAEQELWLEQPLTHEAPEYLFDILHADQPPTLDGRLDEEVWQRAWDSEQRVSLRLGADSNIAPSHVMMYCDDEFLYVAAVCQKIDDAPYVSVPKQRERDGPTHEVDHVELMIDPDRDHRTAFCLRLDYHGRAWDGISNIATWNPQWFVGRHETDHTWTVEVAIPFKQLGWEPRNERSWWGLGIRRTCPSFGTAQWGVEDSFSEDGTQPLVYGMVSVPPLQPNEHETPTEPPGSLDSIRQENPAQNRGAELLSPLDGGLKN